MVFERDARKLDGGLEITEIMSIRFVVPIGERIWKAKFEADPSRGRVVARKGLDPKLKERFIEAMLKLNAPENKKYVRHLYGTDGYVRVNKGTYQSVADMARKYGFMK